MSNAVANIKGPFVLFRADATLETGIGHVSQDIHLANALSSTLEATTVFAGRMDEGALKFLQNHGIECVVPLNTIDEDASLERFLEDTRPLVSVVDVLERDTEHEYMDMFQKYSNVVVALTASSQARFIPSNLVFAFNVNQRQDYYDNTTSPIYYTGPDYFILPPDIQKARKVRTKDIQKVTHILVVIGGGDPNDTSLLIAQILSDTMPGIDATFVVSPLYRQIDVLRNYIEQSTMIGRVEQNVSSMGTYLEIADLLICTCGNIAYEGCAVGVPMITVNQVVRQEEQAATLASMGCLVNAGMENLLTSKHLISVIKKIIENRKLRVSMRQRAMATVDGNGLSRITNLIQSTLSRRSSYKLSSATKK